MGERNMIQRLIDEVYRRGPAQHAHVRALAVALFALRGGRASEAEPPPLVG
jgi:hypothetical protein